MDEKIPVGFLDIGFETHELYEGLTLLLDNPESDSRYRTIKVDHARHAVKITKAGQTVLLKDLYSITDTFIDARMVVADTWVPMGKTFEIGDQKLCFRWKEDLDSDNEIPPSPEAQTYTPRRTARSQRYSQVPSSTSPKPSTSFASQNNSRVTASRPSTSFLVPSTQVSSSMLDGDDDELIFIPETQDFERDVDLPLLPETDCDIEPSQVLEESIPDLLGQSSASASMRLVWNESNEKPDDIRSTSVTPDLDEDEEQEQRTKSNAFTHDLQALFGGDDDDDTNALEIVKGTPETQDQSSILSQVLKVPNTVQHEDASETEDEEEEFYSASSGKKTTPEVPKNPMDMKSPPSKTPEASQFLGFNEAPLVGIADTENSLFMQATQAPPPKIPQLRTESPIDDIYLAATQAPPSKVPTQKILRTESPIDDIYLAETQQPPSKVFHQIFNAETQPFVRPQPLIINDSVYEAETQAFIPRVPARISKPAVVKSPLLIEDDDDDSDTDIVDEDVTAFKVPITPVNKTVVGLNVSNVMTPDFINFPTKLKTSVDEIPVAIKRQRSKLDFEEQEKPSVPLVPTLSASSVFAVPSPSQPKPKKVGIKPPGSVGLSRPKTSKMSLTKADNSTPHKLLAKAKDFEPDTPDFFSMPKTNGRAALSQSSPAPPAPTELSSKRSKMDFEYGEIKIKSSGVSSGLGAMNLRKRSAEEPSEDAPKAKIRPPKVKKMPASVDVKPVPVPAVKIEPVSIRKQATESTIVGLRSRDKENTGKLNRQKSSTSSSGSSCGSNDEIHRILFTKVDPEPYQSKLKLSGYNLANDPNEATVLIAEKIFRTYKFLAALSKGTPIVSVDWVQKLPRSRNKILDFLLNDSDGEKKYKFKLQECLEKTRAKGPVFAGKQLLASPNVKPSPEEIKIIASCCEAEYIDAVSEMDRNRAVVVADKNDKDFIGKVKKKFPKAVIISGEGFMCSILHCKFLLTKQYRIN